MNTYHAALWSTTSPSDEHRYKRSHNLEGKAEMGLEPATLQFQGKGTTFCAIRFRLLGRCCSILTYREAPSLLVLQIVDVLVAVVVIVLIAEM
jgi:hypothetical protein